MVNSLYIGLGQFAFQLAVHFLSSLDLCGRSLFLLRVTDLRSELGCINYNFWIQNMKVHNIGVLNRLLKSMYGLLFICICTVLSESIMF